ncbi:S-adenosyl-L-methionine-dependent methyltransferase [Syncephalis fuscata]|nr:S-adenosyl-L-methionine-dependent methyltransferase [Syncephalis fuscata]
MPWAFWHTDIKRSGSKCQETSSGYSPSKGFLSPRNRNSKNNTRWEIIDGQKYLVMQSGGPAVFSCDGEDEQSRLSSVHQVMRYTLRTNCIVPMADIKRVLDIGCGDGHWLLDMANDYPQTRFTGLDILDQMKDRVLPKNCEFYCGDVLQGLPFSDGYFDLIHQRFMYLFIPSNAWSALISEMARILKPGGQILLIERQFHVEKTNDVIGTMLGAFNSAISNNEVTTSICDRLDQVLDKSGFVDINKNSINIPVGEWGGVPGRLMGEAVVSWIVGSREIIVKRSQLSYEEFDARMSIAPEEFNKAHAYFTIHMYTAQKAGAKKVKNRKPIPLVVFLKNTNQIIPVLCSHIPLENHLRNKLLVIKL